LCSDDLRLLQISTLIGMWLIPVVLSLRFYWWRFITIWTVFSIITGFVSFKATRKPLTGTTPRSDCRHVSFCLNLVYCYTFDTLVETLDMLRQLINCCIIIIDIQLLSLIHVLGHISQSCRHCKAEARLGCSSFMLSHGRPFSRPAGE